ncbi:MAG TPA: ribosomal protein S18-alanine N-acetyltransferase [Gemmatimonadales bacterium]|nr:ribosomal protein S18-alanine N-acetyltransferase [Gemmatimonadales bacterium]
MAGPSTIRAATAADLAPIHEIERSAFSDPWRPADFRECLASGVPFLVAEERGLVSGYVIARHAADEGEILNLGVAPAARRRGIGRGLVTRVLDDLAALGARRAFLEVRESNTAARNLYEGSGFSTVGRRTRYYRHPVEDALILAVAIPGRKRSA